ncbi:MAG TPA: DUF2339 domain-containing protein [Solirubrobacteraceae bacterium]|nr:DUF2339 domain-containing protein [Solirubrobacteraceae bacterium]
MQVEDRLAALEARTRVLEDIVRHWSPDGPAPAAPPARVSTPHEIAAAPVRVSSPRLTVPAARSARDLEDAFGGRLLAWVGGLAVALGIIFLAGIAVSRGWIGEAERTILAGLLSGALTAAGVWAHERRGHRQAARAAVAAGLVGQFATALVAGSLYDLVPPPLAVFGALTVGVTATVIAIRWSSQGIAALGIVGALLAQPFLLGLPDVASELVLLFATAASATAVAVWRRWAWLSLATFVFTTPQWWVYLAMEGGPGDPTTLAVLIPFGALTATSATAIGRGANGRDGIVMLALNAYALVAGGADLGRPGMWIAGLAVAHLALGIVARRTLPRPFSIGALALGVVLADVAASVFLDGIPLEMAWAAGGLVLAVLARSATVPIERNAAIAGTAAQLLLAIAAALVLAPPAALVDGLAHPGTAAAALVIAALAVVSASVALPAGPWVTVARFLAALLVLYTASVELVTAFVDTPQRAQALLSGLWAVTGVGTLLAGLIGDRPMLRHAALALLTITAGKVFLYDLASLTSLSRVASFVAFGLLLLAGAFAWERVRGRDLGGMTGSPR